MTHLPPRVLFLALCAAPAAAQMPFLFTTSQTEQTLSGSGGTVLKTLRPNEVAMVEFWSCTGLSAEKWAPRTCYHTMAGDENGDTAKWNPTLFGSIDALCEILGPVGLSNQRTVFWSPSVAMQPGVSGLPSIRPGDTARIIRNGNGNGDGQVEYFLPLEQVVQALGMPTGSIVDVDAIAADPSYGVFFSLDVDTTVNCGCSTPFVRDGDVLMIPNAAISWTGDFRVQAVVPNSAVVVYSEAQMDAFVGNAVVSNHLWQCLGAVGDVEGLDIDWNGPVQTLSLCSSVTVQVPALAFTGESMTGCSVLTTTGGGTILQRGCATLGTSCWFGPTTGAQIGLQPPSSNGVPSYVNALTTAFPRQFTVEPQLHQFPNGGSAVLDLYTPGPFTLLFARFDSMAANSVAPSQSYWNLHFPDEYITGNAGVFFLLGGVPDLQRGDHPLAVQDRLAGRDPQLLEHHRAQHAGDDGHPVN